jgi:hypothetical protein
VNLFVAVTLKLTGALTGKKPELPMAPIVETDAF